MNKDRALVLLNAISRQVPAQQSRSGWLTASCPLEHWTHDNGVDRNPSFGLNLEKPDPFLNCFSCGAHGSATEWLYEIAHRRKKDPDQHFTADIQTAMTMIQESINEAPSIEGLPSYDEMYAQGEVELVWFPEHWIDSFPSVLHVVWARKYLHERGVSMPLAMALDLRADTNQKRVCFPIRDFDSVHRGLHGRAVVAGVEPRYRMYTYEKQTNPIVWYGENWLDPQKPVLVVEGPFDVASALRVYDNVVSPLFANPSYVKIERLGMVEDWVTCLDTGKGGESGREKFTKALQGYNLKHLVPEKKDPGSMTEDELRELLDPHLPLIANRFTT
jgi:DNA primase